MGTELGVMKTDSVKANADHYAPGYQTASFHKLACKALALGEEKRVLRAQELKWHFKAKKAREREQLDVAEGAHLREVSIMNHTRWALKPEARATNLVIAFLHGKVYLNVESHRRTPPDWERVIRIAKKYSGDKNIEQALFSWMPKKDYKALADIRKKVFEDTKADMAAKLVVSAEDTADNSTLLHKDGTSHTWKARVDCAICSTESVA